MKFISISDTHYNHKKIRLPDEPFDVAFHCGDFCKVDFGLLSEFKILCV